MRPFVSLEDFKQYLTALDESLSEMIRLRNEKLAGIELPVEIYAVGGFSLMYYGMRYSGTEDIDSAKRLQEPVKELIRKIAAEKEIPVDWLNDIPATRLFYDRASFTWQDTGWIFSNIRLYVIDLKDLLKNKLGVADKVLTLETDRSNIRDFDDVEAIIDRLGCDYNNIEELEAWFQEQSIRLSDYPNVYDKFVERLKDDGLYWPDGHI